MERRDDAEGRGAEGKSARSRGRRTPVSAQRSAPDVAPRRSARAASCGRQTSPPCSAYIPPRLWRWHHQLGAFPKPTRLATGVVVCDARVVANWMTERAKVQAA